MKIYAYLVTILLFTNLVTAQSWQDSIYNIETDSLKLTYLNNKITQHIYADLNEASILTHLYDSISTVLQEDKYLGYALVLQGNIEHQQSNHSKATDFFIQALEYLETANAPEFLAQTYNNLASSYQVRNDNETSSRYFLKALDIYESLRDTLWVANVNSNLGLQYLNDGKLNQAELHLNEAIKNFDLIGQQLYKGISHLNRGNLRIEQAKYKDAINDYTLAQQLVPESVSPLAKAASDGGIGTAYNRLKQHHTALPYLIASLNKAEVIEHTGQLSESNRELADLYHSIGDYKSAFKHQAQYIIHKDSLFTTEQNTKLADAITKYEVTQKENEIELLNTQNELQATRLDKRNNQLLLLGLSSLLLLGLLGSFYLLNKKIKSQNRIIEKSLNEKETLLKEIHHRVKNNLQVISALLSLQSAYVKDDEALKALQEGEGRVHSMALIHQNLYQYDNLKGVNTKDYFEKLVQNLIRTYKTDERNIELEMDIEPILLDVDTMIPLGLLVNELTSNAMKHAFQDQLSGKIKIVLKEKDENLHLHIEDDGRGAELSQLENTSFGFSLIQSFAKKLEADLDIVNDQGLQVKLAIKNYQKAG